MRSRLAELARDVDVVILDSPPVLAVSDPAALAGLVDGVLLVVHAQTTHGQRASHAVSTLQKAGGHLLGAVLNATPLRQGAYYSSPQAYATRPSPTGA
jgi:Mrp family chromosome partitioning ATPase